MAKKALHKTAVLGAVVGVALYGLFRTNKGKKAREDIQKFVKEIFEKKEVLGKISQTTYDEAVDMAGRLYKGSKKMTTREIEEAKRVIDELKEEWKGKKPNKTKK